MYFVQTVHRSLLCCAGDDTTPEAMWEVCIYLWYRNLQYVTVSDTYQAL